MSLIHKSYEFRIYPNNIQIAFLKRSFGCARYIFNYFLNLQILNYKDGGKFLNFNRMSELLTELKQESGFEFLKEVNSQSTQSTLKNLETAYKNFFNKKSKFPNFKQKSSGQSVKIPQHFEIRNNYLFIPKLKSGIKTKQHRKINGKPICIFISKTPSEEYYASVVCEEDAAHLPRSDKAIGIDLGLTNLVTTTSSEVITNPKFAKQLVKTIKFQHQRLSKKEKKSSNQGKSRIKLAITYQKISNKRSDFLHKLSHKIINENQVIITENLATKNMMKNHRLAGSIADASWHEFVRQLEYKSKWYGRTFHKVDRFFPSSKICNNCGYKLEKLSLSVREWQCPNCKTSNDRDQNAAKNIREEGILNLIKEKILPTNVGNVDVALLLSKAEGRSGLGINSDLKQKLGEAPVNGNFGTCFACPEIAKLGL